MTEKKTPGREKMTQGTFRFTRWGGKRKGAGRKPNEEKAGVSHSARPRLSRHHPVHVTLRLRRGLPSLRHKVPYRALKRVFGACERFGFRLLHYSAQTNHIHCLCEAVDGRALSRGVQGLAVRLARALNKLWKRAGKAFAERFHSHILRTPKEVRTALLYVLQNARHHGIWIASLRPDPFSSGARFDGWRGFVASALELSETVALPEPRTWLFRVGWRRHGELGLDESPVPDIKRRGVVARLCSKPRSAHG